MTSENAPPSFLETADGARLGYCKVSGKAPTVVFLGGFRSDMTGNKARAIESWCRQRGQAFLRFDYQAHGVSSGVFEECSVGTWSTDAANVIDAVTEGPLVLVGSSMGGWIMSLLARARPERIAGLVGIAVAPNFTSEIMWPAMDETTRQKLMTDGVIRVPSAYDDEPYPITKNMIDDGLKHDVLGEVIPVDCPVRLIHGLEDPDVPWEMSLKLSKSIRSSDVVVSLVKDGDHRLSKPHELAQMLGLIDEVLVAAGDAVAQT